MVKEGIGRNAAARSIQPPPARPSGPVPSGPSSGRSPARCGRSCSSRRTSSRSSTTRPSRPTSPRSCPAPSGSATPVVRHASDDPLIAYRGFLSRSAPGRHRRLSFPDRQPGRRPRPPGERHTGRVTTPACSPSRVRRPAARARPRDLGVRIGLLPTGARRTRSWTSTGISGRPSLDLARRATPPAGRGVARTGVTAIVPVQPGRALPNRVAAGAGCPQRGGRDDRDHLDRRMGPDRDADLPDLVDGDRTGLRRGRRGARRADSRGRPRSMP